MAAAKTIKAKEIISAPIRYTNRLKTLTISFADIGVNAVIQSLNTAKQLAVDTTPFSDRRLFAFELCRYGIKDMTGLLDQDDKPVELERETVNILGKDYEALTLDFVMNLPIEIVAVLAEQIRGLSNMDTTEIRRLSFTIV